ncbi:hypothetical protein M0R72_05680 [Candidatus Pacearchaeota archaeon]|jgi:hypothetical protein|nr:hypothetical protein [Candidatus Pacearchaeota archaeon]
MCDDKKESMLVKRLVEQSLEVGHDLNVENIYIGKKKCSLHIKNGTNPNNKEGSLYLTFEYKDKNGNPEEYKIEIDEKKIEFRKGIWGEGDPDSTEGIERRNLLVKKEGSEKGKIFWSEYSPNQDETYLQIPFMD